MKKVLIYTDGACKGNPGPGGWGAILKWNNRCKEIGGYDPNTTNNRMELSAVINALEALNEPCEVEITTDSKYVIEGYKGVEDWKKNGWRTKGKRNVANRDLWEKVLQLAKIHKIEFLWVKGHNGHPENERCDQISNQYI